MVVFRCGVLLTGVADTTPAGGETPPVPVARAAVAPRLSRPTAAPSAMRYLRTIPSPMDTKDLLSLKITPIYIRRN